LPPSQQFKSPRRETGGGLFQFAFPESDGGRTSWRHIPHAMLPEASQAGRRPNLQARPSAQNLLKLSAIANAEVHENLSRMVED
jgi:hypothetical protein